MAEETEGTTEQTPKQKGITVVSRSLLGRRRAGIAFGPQKRYIPFADLTEEQVAAIRDDSELIVFEGKEQGALEEPIADSVRKTTIIPTEQATPEQLEDIEDGLEPRSHPSQTGATNAMAPNRPAIEEEARRSAGPKKRSGSKKKTR